MSRYRNGPAGGGQFHWQAVTLAEMLEHTKSRELADGVTPDEQSLLNSDAPNRKGWSPPELTESAKFTDGSYIVLLSEPGFGGSEETAPDPVEVAWFIVTPKQGETNIVRTLQEGDRITP